NAVKIVSEVVDNHHVLATAQLYADGGFHLRKTMDPQTVEDQVICGAFRLERNKVVDRSPRCASNREANEAIVVGPRCEHNRTGTAVSSKFQPRQNVFCG